ncbi:MAG: glucosaminidase domain-containing protein [Pseudomonadota bacterium]|nr:glucosaminidase domain-containing protein [Pseudomonadota bacterium]
MFRFERLIIGTLLLLTTGVGISLVVYPVSHQIRVPQASFVAAIDHLQPANSIKQTRRLRIIQTSKVTAGYLYNTFSRISYDLGNIRNGDSSVPRLFVKSLPADMRAISVIKKRKELFFQAILPLILRVNDQIMVDRKRIQSLKLASGKKSKLSAEDRLWLAFMEEKYKVRNSNIKELLTRVDTIPPSLALAQAAEESGWGTSRFVKEGNALFGQWTAGTDQGLVPDAREKNRDYLVKSFSSLQDGVTAYAHNLNTHLAYRKFRKNRAEMRTALRELNGIALSKHLLSYSKRGAGYVRSIVAIIRSNKLGKLDGAVLTDRQKKTY